MDRERSANREHDYPSTEGRHGSGRDYPQPRHNPWPEDRHARRGRGYADAQRAEERMRQAQADFDFRWGGDGRHADPARYGQEYGPGWYDARDYRGDARYRSGTTADDYFADPGWGAQEHDFRDRPGEHRGRGPAGYRRSDERIREDVSDRLTDDPYLDASGIEVKVSSCEVTLDGNVDSRYGKRRAEFLADQVSGVAHVQNNLRVRGPHDAAPAAASLPGKKTR